MATWRLAFYFKIEFRNEETKKRRGKDGLRKERFSASHFFLGIKMRQSPNRRDRVYQKEKYFI
jgi:hypothetical protein